MHHSSSASIPVATGRGGGISGLWRRCGGRRAGLGRAEAVECAERVDETLSARDEAPAVRGGVPWQWSEERHGHKLHNSRTAKLTLPNNTTTRNIETGDNSDHTHTTQQHTTVHDTLSHPHHLSGQSGGGRPNALGSHTNSHVSVNSLYS